MTTKNYFGLALASVLVLGATACGGSEDDADSGAGALAGDGKPGSPPAAAGAAIAPGEYVLDNASVGATLTIKSATAASVAYNLGVLGKTGSEHNGELENRTATRSGGAGPYADTVEADCKITIQSAAADSIQLKQTGPCSDAGFGAFLDGSGTYKKKATASIGLVGLYETETTHRAWAIRFTSESPPTFRIFAGHLEDSSERVDAKGLVGKLSGTTVTYENGPDCAITLAKTDRGLHVTQAGTCIKLGFPPNDDLSMSDDSGTDFSRIDNQGQCFDTKELAVGVNLQACKNPL